MTDHLSIRRGVLNVVKSGSRPSDRVGTSVRPIILLTLALSLIIIATSNSAVDKTKVIFPGTIVLAVTILGIGWGRSWRSGIDLLEPPVFISLWCLLFYILPTILWAAGLITILENPVISEDITHWLTISSWATAAGLVAVWCGYISITRRKHMEFSPPPSAKPSIRVNLAIVLYVIGLLLRFLLYTYGLRGNASVFKSYYAGGAATIGFDQLIDVIMKCLAATGPALFFYVFRSRRLYHKDYAFVIGILACEMTLGVLSGSRGGIMLTLFYFGAYYRYSRGKYPSWKLLALSIVMILVSIPIINQFRLETMETTQMNPHVFIQALESASVQSINMPPVQIVDEASAVIFGRQMGIFQMQAAVMRLHPEILPYKGIDQLVYFPISLIPRAIWPNKPNTFDALEATRIYGGEAVLTFSSPIMPADLYSMAGWPALVLGMFVFGIVQGLAYKYLIGSAKIINLVLFTMIFFELSHWEGQLSGILALLLRSLPLFWLFLNLVLFRKVPKIRRNANRYTSMEAY